MAIKEWVSTRGGPLAHPAAVEEQAAKIDQGKSLDDVENDVTKLVPPEQWRHAHHWLILHGRYVCVARSPKCEICGLQQACKYYQSTLKN